MIMVDYCHFKNHKVWTAFYKKKKKKKCNLTKTYQHKEHKSHCLKADKLSVRCINVANVLDFDS